ncbi:hypothetical protein E5Q_04572 [Mixia osmundae IAM 14324]|uniref:Uncharacterized protein n=1 Tax=Mixia osmundae (strain CBS 9802 / IAM 14324 / JCM 22182 / KY 12970) TaxID=764103 RepID=G7E4Y2_MIXOS|nr:hypothetical protein E5Q_04572 [Mixia osmundae IAM 14324]
MLPSPVLQSRALYPAWLVKDHKLMHSFCLGHADDFALRE